MKISLQEVSWHDSEVQLLEVRFKVFVDEQQVPEEIEQDEWDAKSRHVLMFDGDRPIATGRLLPDGHIGRVAVLKEFRGNGFGALVMKELISLAVDADFAKVELSSQVQARPFYESLGFEVSGEAYMEAGIPHIYMVKNL